MVEVVKDYCSSCGSKSKSLMRACKGKENKKGIVLVYQICRKCNLKRSKKYRSTEEGRAAIRKNVYESIARHPEKQQARYEVLKSIARGEMVRGSCEVCKQTNAHAHHKNYEKPLEVTWLCRKHHSDVHRGVIVI